MRKLKSKADEAKKRKRNQIVVGVLLIFVMLFSTLGFAFNGGGNDEEGQENANYNGFEFIAQNGYWFLELGNYVFVFSNSPEKEIDLEVEGEIKLLNNYLGRPLYIYSENEISSYEIYRNMFSETNQVIQRVQNACLNRSDFNLSLCSDDFPIKTCEDNFIWIKESEENIITQVENCVIIEGEIEKLPQITDEFLFRTIGIKKPLVS